jgi:hypothetical protein
MKAMRVEMAFFDGDTLLTRANVLVHSIEDECTVVAERGDRFEITRQFEEPASRLFIKCYDGDGNPAGRSAMRMGVHNSDDWEAVALNPPYELCFKTTIVDCENPDWATQEPIPEDAGDSK